MRIALAQINPRLGRFAQNLENTAAVIHEARLRDSHLVAFPEAALTGYAFRSREEALELLPGDLAERAVDIVSRSCGESLVLLGLIEGEGEEIFNTVLLISSKGLVARYRKAHLPYLGVDRFVTPGPEPPLVVDTPFGRLGVLICFELRFPEVARVLALKGADIIFNITNWPQGAEANATFIGRTRALENRVFLASCNRCGMERGVQFIGRSQVVSPEGRILAKAGPGEEILYADIDVSLARDKSVIKQPGEYEMHLFRERKPHLYHALTQIEGTEEDSPEEK